jgi:MFS family permease
MFQLRWGISPTKERVMAKSSSTVTVPETGYRRGAVMLLGLIGAIQVADPIVSSLALVKASDELNFTASIQALAAGVSTLALAAFAISGGVLADRLGRRGVLMASLIVSSIGELLTAVSTDPVMYIAGRVITGMALAITFGSAYAMLRAVSSEKSLGSAMAMFNVLNGVVPVVVMVLAGVLMGVNWRLAYVLLPIVAFVLFWFIRPVLPKMPKTGGGKIDYFGLIFVGVGIAALLYGISNAAGGLTKPAFLVPVIAGIISLVLFAIVENRGKHAVFPIKILAHPAFLGAVIMGIFWNFGAGGLSQMLPNIWQYVTHIPASLIGVAQLPMSAAGVIGSLLAGALLSRGVAARFISITGYGLLVLAFIELAFVDAKSGFLVFLFGMIVAGIGYMMNATTQGNLFLTLAPKSAYGAVTSSKMAVGQFGYALGLTGTSTLVSLFTLNKVDELSKGAVTGEDNWDAITSYMSTGSTTNSALSAISVTDIEAAYASAFNTTSLISGAIVLVAGIVMFISLSRKKAAIPVDDFLAGVRTVPTAAPAAKGTKK